MATTKRMIKKSSNSKKNDLTSFEKIQFLQFEYEWQKQRKRDLVEKSKLFLCWNAAVFSFAILFTDIEKIISVLKTHEDCCIIGLTVVLIILFIISAVLLAISTVGFFDCLKNKPVMCFETQDYIDGVFNPEKIITDYRTIIISYDDDIKEMVEHVEHSTIIMVIGISVMLCVEFMLKIVVYI